MNWVRITGVSFLSEITTNCSGRYVLAWQPTPGKFAFGTSYMMGKTLQFDAENLKIKVLQHSKDCTIDYGQNFGGNHPIHPIQLSGTRSQILLTGVITEEVYLGRPPQKFTVQMDTGSQDFLLNTKECMLYTNATYSDGGTIYDIDEIFLIIFKILLRPN